MDERDYREYECRVKEELERMLRHDIPNGEIEVWHDCKLRGQSGFEHQVDIAAKYVLGGVRILMIVECKQYQRSLDNKVVSELVFRLNDLGAQKGILVTTVGFQEGALQIAEANGIALVLTEKSGEGPWNVVLKSLLGALLLGRFGSLGAKAASARSIGKGERNIWVRAIGGHGRLEGSVARGRGLEVGLLIWLGKDSAANEHQINNGMKEALTDVDMVIVGSDVLFRKDMEAEALLGYITRVRKALPTDVAVTTAEGYWQAKDKRVEAACDICLPPGYHFLPSGDRVLIKCSYADVPPSQYPLGWGYHYGRGSG